MIGPPTHRDSGNDGPPRRTRSAAGGSPARFRLLAGLFPVLLISLLFAPAVVAEAPSEVAEELEDDGVFIGFGRREIDEAALIAAVEDARFDGLRLVAVAPRDPQPTAAAFARRIQEQTDADAAIIFPIDGMLETYVIEDLSTSRIRATEAAREFDDPARAVEAFAIEIGSKRETGTPQIVDDIMRALVLMALVIGVVVLIEQGLAFLKRSTSKTK